MAVELRTSVALLLVIVTGCRSASQCVEEPPKGLPGTFEYALTKDFPLEYVTRTPIVFVDSKGSRWELPIGTLLRGGGMPPVVWSLNGGPLNPEHMEAFSLYEYHLRKRTAGIGVINEMLLEVLMSSGLEYRKVEFYVSLASVLLDRTTWDYSYLSQLQYTRRAEVYGYLVRAWSYTDVGTVESRTAIGELMEQGRLDKTRLAMHIDGVLTSMIKNELIRAGEVLTRK